MFAMKKAKEEESPVEISITDLKSCCRLCLNSNGTSSFLEIADSRLPSEATVSVVEAIKKVANVELKQFDQLSSKICELCATRLDEAYCFIRDICNNNATMQTLFNGDALIDDQYVIVYQSNEDDIKAQDEIAEEAAQNSSGSSDEDPEDCTETVNAVELILNEIVPAKRKLEARARSKANVLAIHECKLCDKKFRRKSNLIDHQRFHEQVKLYQCEFCDKSFVQAGNLRAHLRIHTSEKPYQCPLCKKSFNQSGTLKTHMRAHANIKPFSCETCDKAFVSNSDLTKHKLTHSQRKGFTCVICEKLFFTQKIHLRNHLNRHHALEDIQQLLVEGTINS